MAGFVNITAELRHAETGLLRSLSLNTKIRLGWHQPAKPSFGMTLNNISDGNDIDAMHENTISVVDVILTQPSLLLL